MRDTSAEILFQSFLQEAPVSSSGKSRDVHSLMLFIQHLPCRLRRQQPSRMPRRMLLERLSLRVTCPNYASFRLLTVTPPPKKKKKKKKKKEILWAQREADLAPHPVVGLVLRVRDAEKSFLRHLVSKVWILFSSFFFFFSHSANRVHVSRP